MEDPTTEDLISLFKTSNAMHSEDVKYLKMHFASENYTTTATRLAKALGFKKHTGVNLHYGTFAKTLAMEFGWTEEDKKKERFVWLCFLMKIEKINGEWHFTLWNDVVEALKAIGWE